MKSSEENIISKSMEIDFPCLLIIHWREWLKRTYQIEESIHKSNDNHDDTILKIRWKTDT